MEASKKRKRESDCPRITYHAPGRTFDRLFRESSLADMQDVVRRKMGVQSTTAIRFFQIRDGQTIDLDDDDDFDAFQSLAHTKSVIDVRVLVEDSVNRSAQPSTNAALHEPSSRLPLRAQPTTTSIQLDQLPQLGTVDNAPASLNISDATHPPQKKKRKRERSNKTMGHQLETQPVPDPELVSEPSLAQVHTFLNGSAVRTTDLSNARCQTEPPPTKRRKKKAEGDEAALKPPKNAQSSAIAEAVPIEPLGKKPKRARSKPPAPTPSHLENIRALAENTQSNSGFAKQLADVITTTGEANSKALGVHEQTGKKVTKRKKAEKELTADDASPSDVPNAIQIAQATTMTKKTTEAHNTKAIAEKPTARKRRNTVSSVEPSAEAETAVKAAMAKLLAEKKAMLLGNLSKPPPILSTPQVARATSLPPAVDGNSTEPLRSASSSLGVEIADKASSSSSVTAVAPPPLSIAPLPASSRKSIARLNLDAVIRGPVGLRRVIDELSSSESEDEKMSSLEEGDDSEPKRKTRRKAESAVESSDDEANSNSDAEEAARSDVRQVPPELDTIRRETMVDATAVDEPSDDASSQNPMKSKDAPPSNDDPIMFRGSPDVADNAELDGSKALPVKQPPDIKAIEFQVEETPIVPETQDQPPFPSQRQLRSRKISEPSKPGQGSQDGTSPRTSKRQRKPTKKITDMEPPPLPATSTPMSIRSRSKGRGISTPTPSSEPLRKSNLTDQTSANGSTGKIPSTSWTVLRQPSPNSSFTSAIDELHSSPAPSQSGGVSNNAQVRTPPVTPLFLLSNSQTPFPYSQYNEPDDIESDREPILARTPTSRSKLGFRSLTDIASQHSIFSTPATLRPATFPSTKNRQRRISDFYPPNLQDDVESDGSGSGSGAERESHIPRGRRAGTGR